MTFTKEELLKKKKEELLKQKTELEEMIEQLWEDVDRMPDGEEYEFNREGLMDCAHEAQEDLDEVERQLKELN
ncbi:hypothetical protein Bp8pC_175 [Bacillus phage Bp8p-C]|uniref:Uncharacterized protein n=2 Tax=Agatevirus Bp8pC TaxID=1910937 RepID=A0A0A0PLK8_9CAUD|nr:hypothetical protein AXJ20_gp173 [Bacillus phage Bp8p-C]YP_009784475.1 hypothetical protein QLX39_gp173 [Bacillus phage Bp8p-T]AHJ87605.1 hypothetical protein Bp8pC_175 [Bacillus phage Bp8p-C]AHJ87816.1 hypothetical protein Bp8pT_175 [Bacillus phage Bp8p-T]